MKLVFYKMSVQKSKRQLIQGVYSEDSDGEKRGRYNTNVATFKEKSTIRVKKIELLIKSGSIDIFTTLHVNVVNVDIKPSKNWVIVDKTIDQKYWGADIYEGGKNNKKIGTIRRARGRKILVKTKNIENFIVLSGKSIRLEISHGKSMPIPNE